MNESRVWRNLAIEWFDAMNREIGSKFDREFLADIHRRLNLGTEDELDSARRYNGRVCRKIVEAAGTPKDKRSIDDLEFFIRWNTFLLALYELALEDFRYKRFVVHFYRTIDDEEPCDSAVVTATEHLDETHIANVAQIMTNERGMQTFTYEEAP